MKLFLSSYRAGAFEDELVSFFGEGSEVAVITNAKDYKEKSERIIKVQETIDFFARLGLVASEIDLRKYFTSQVNLDTEISNYKNIWLAGGNTFLLRRALSYTGLDKYLTRKVKEGSIAYGGESAGVIMAGPTLHGSEDDSTNEDDPHYIPDGYNDEVLWDGLGLLDYVVVPHYKSADIGESIDGYVDYLKKEKIPFKTITDEQVVVVDGDKVELLK